MFLSWDDLLIPNHRFHSLGSYTYPKSQVSKLHILYPTFLLDSYKYFYIFLVSNLTVLPHNGRESHDMGHLVEQEIWTTMCTTERKEFRRSCFI